MLIVEDFEIVRVMLCEALERSCRCLAVGTAEEALGLIAETTVDVVITDLKLPGMDGLGLLGELRARFPGVPVIVVTGGVEGVGEREALEAGAFGYLLKPYPVDEVEAMVLRAAGGNR